MVVNCCLVPCNRAKVRDEEVEREKRYVEDDDGRYMEWRRFKTKSKLKSSKKKKSKSSSTVISKYDERDEDEEQDEEMEPGQDDCEERRRRETRKSEKKKDEYKKQKVQSKSDDSVRSEQSRNNDSNGIFREREEPSVKSDPFPASLPTSILAESFYSDDSLGVDDLTFEVDYATSTPLFEALEQNDWGNVLFFLRTGKFFSGGTLIRGDTIDDPGTQARTWVHCQDEQGELVWRQLPLHAAICLAAPLVVVQRLAQLFPRAKECQDSFGNLPVSLAAKLHGQHSYVYQAVALKKELATPQRYTRGYPACGMDLPPAASDDNRARGHALEHHLSPTVKSGNTKQYRAWERPHIPHPSSEWSKSSTYSKESLDRPLTPNGFPAYDGVQHHRSLERPQTLDGHSRQWDESDSYDSYSSDGEVETEYKIYQRRSSGESSRIKRSYDDEAAALINDDNFEVYYYY